MPGFAKTFLIIAFTTKCFCCPFAQGQELPVFKQISHPFMPAITSSSFYFTEDGLIWFSTAQGLTSFDGSEVVYYSTPEETSKFLLSGINGFAEDKEHNIYLGTPVNGLYFNRKKRTFTPLSYTFKDIKKTWPIGVGNIFIDEDGLVYMNYSGFGMLIYDPDTKRIEHYNLDSTKTDWWYDRRLNSVACFAAHLTDHTKLWLGTFSGIYLFDKKTKKLSRNFEISNPVDPKFNYPGASKEHYDIEKMELPDDTTIWFNSHTRGIGRYNTKTGKTTIFLHEYDKKNDRWAKIYIIPGSGLAKLSPGKYLLGIDNPHPGIFDTKTGTLEFIKISPPPAFFDRVRFVTNDKTGNVWLLNKGLIYAAVPDHYRLQTSRIQRLPINDHRYNNIYDMVFDSGTNSYLAAGRTNDGIHVLDSHFNEKEIIPVPLMSNYFLEDVAITDHITVDGSKRYWTTGLQTCVWLQGRKKFELVQSVYPSLAWLKKIEFSDILATRDGHIVFRQFNNGQLFIVNHKTLYTDTIKLPMFKTSAEYDINSYFMDYDSSRNLIYSSNEKGIIQYNLTTKELKIFDEKNIFGSVKQPFSYLKFKLDHSGRIWIMIQQYGIRILDPATLTSIDSIPFGQRGLLKLDCTDIKYGGENFMFFKSLNGIIVYNYEKGKSIIFDNNNGLSYQRPKSFLYCNNHLVIGQDGQIEHYELNNFKKFNFNLRPALNTVTTDSGMVFIRSGDDRNVMIKLPYHQNSLSFSFSAQEFFFPERIEYAYQLSGIDKDWQYTHSFNRKVNYTRLSPGKYVFRLKAQLEGDNWQGETVEYFITIVPAFWQTNWFKILVTALIMAAIFGLAYWRIRTVRKQEQVRASYEKELLELEARALRAQMNPHFIFNSLNSIKSLINKNENEKAARYLTIFSKLIRTLFQNSDRREISLFEELETCRLYTQLEKMRFGEKVDFSFDIGESIDLKDIKVPALILQPFIENAIWHGLVPKESGGTVLVSVTEKGGIIECSVDDDGIGRELSRQYKAQYNATHESKGIGLTRSRLEIDKLLNNREDTISITDKVNKHGKPAGTTVVLTFKENSI